MSKKVKRGYGRLTEDEVRQIKRLHETRFSALRHLGETFYGVGIARGLAEQFGVTERNINHIISGRSWKHVR